MALIRTNRELFPSYSDLFDDFFNSEVSDWRQRNYSTTNTTLPKVNIKEDEDGFVVEMAAPGLKKKDFNIQLDQNLLTISSEKGEEKVEEVEKYTKREYAYQAFTRSFTLPDTADGQKISAKYEDGVLKVSIPKREEAKPKPAKTIDIS